MDHARLESVVAPPAIDGAATPKREAPGPEFARIRPRRLGVCANRLHKAGWNGGRPTPSEYGGLGSRPRCPGDSPTTSGTRLGAPVLGVSMTRLINPSGSPHLAQGRGCLRFTRQGFAAPGTHRPAASQLRLSECTIHRESAVADPSAARGAARRPSPAAAKTEGDLMTTIQEVRGARVERPAPSTGSRCAKDPPRAPIPNAPKWTRLVHHAPATKRHWSGAVHDWIKTTLGCGAAKCQPGGRTGTKVPPLTERGRHHLAARDAMQDAA